MGCGVERVCGVEGVWYRWECGKEVNISSFNRTFGCPIICTYSIHNAILFIDTSNEASYNQVDWLVIMPYLSIKASNGGVWYRGEGVNPLLRSMVHPGYSPPLWTDRHL